MRSTPMKFVRDRIEVDTASERFCCMSEPMFSRMNYLHCQGQVANDSTYFTCSYYGFVPTQLHYKPAVTCGKKSICDSEWQEYVEFLHRLVSDTWVSTWFLTTSTHTRYNRWCVTARCMAWAMAMPTIRSFCILPDILISLCRLKSAKEVNKPLVYGGSAAYLDYTLRAWWTAIPYCTYMLFHMTEQASVKEN